jgi:ribonuclease HI
MQLVKHNRVQLIWVPGNEGSAGNEIADQLAKLGSEWQCTGLEQACSISLEVAKKTVRDWIL